MAGLLGDQVLDLRTGTLLMLDPATGMLFDPKTGQPIDDTGGQPSGTPGLLDPKIPNTGSDGKTPNSGGKLPNSGPTIPPWFPPGFEQRPAQQVWMPPPNVVNYVPPSASWRRR